MRKNLPIALLSIALLISSNPAVAQAGGSDSRSPQLNGESRSAPDEELKLDWPGQYGSDVDSAAEPVEPEKVRLAQTITSYSPDRLLSLTNEILTKEIELLRLNTYFRLETTEQGRAKPWRTFLYNLGGSAVSTAGITTVAAERWRTWRRPATANRNTLKAGPTLLLIGHSIIAGGVLLEASVDFMKDRAQKRRGFDANTSKKRAIDLRDSIDRMLSERALLVDALPEAERIVAHQEGRVLKDIRDMVLSQYAQFHVRAVKRKAARNFAYLNGFSAATTGGYIGSLCGLLAVSNRNPRIAGPAGIGFTISGANIATGPILGRAIAGMAGNAARKRMNRDLGVVPAAHIEDDCELLRKTHDTSVEGAGRFPGLSTRIAVYKEIDEIFRQQAAMNSSEKKKADKEFIERCFFNAAVGGTKIGWGVQLLNAGFSFSNSPAVKVPTVPVKAGGKTILVPTARRQISQSELFSKRVAEGATTYLPGTSIWIFDTLQARTRGEMDLYTMGTQNALPHQKLKNRISRLDDMEARLKSK